MTGDWGQDSGLPVAGDWIEDNYDKNAILFECGMHPREWLASESCLLMAEYLIRQSRAGLPHRK